MKHVHDYLTVATVFTGDEILDMRYCACGNINHRTWIAGRDDEHDQEEEGPQ